LMLCCAGAEFSLPMLNGRLLELCTLIGGDQV
jgi:hypothetical protein